MIEIILDYAFRSFWHFIGIWIFLSMLVGLVYIVLFYTTNLLLKILVFRNIRKCGYPPAHCDALGDSKAGKKKKIHTGWVPGQGYQPVKGKTEMNNPPGDEK